jgi:hypothetical protein
MRFLTCADSDADTALGCDGDGGGEDDEELNGLRPPKDIVESGLRAGAEQGQESGDRRSWLTRRIRAAWYVACSGENECSEYAGDDTGLGGGFLILT